MCCSAVGLRDMNLQGDTCGNRRTKPAGSKGPRELDSSIGCARNQGKSCVVRNCEETPDEDPLVSGELEALTKADLESRIQNIPRSAIHTQQEFALCASGRLIFDTCVARDETRSHSMNDS